MHFKWHIPVTEVISDRDWREILSADVSHTRQFAPLHQMKP